MSFGSTKPSQSERVKQQPGFLITFEGLDGSGKTTQIKLLADWLTQRSQPFLVTRQPGGTAIGTRIRELLLNSNLESKSAGLSPLTELAMMFADRAQAIQEVIAPALAARKLVLCDRFTDSTEAYQGGGRELGSEIVLELHKILCANLQPDLTFLLFPPVSASLGRARRRNSRAIAESGTDENRFEREQDPFFNRVQSKYFEIAAREPSRVVVLDGELSIEQVHSHVRATLETRLAGFNK